MYFGPVDKSTQDGEYTNVTLAFIGPANEACVTGYTLYIDGVVSGWPQNTLPAAAFPNGFL